MGKVPGVRFSRERKTELGGVGSHPKRGHVMDEIANSMHFWFSLPLPGRNFIAESVQIPEEGLGEGWIIWTNPLSRYFITKKCSCKLMPDGVGILRE